MKAKHAQTVIHKERNSTTKLVESLTFSNAMLKGIGFRANCDTWAA